MNSSRVSGKIHSKEYFQFVEEEKLNPQKIFELLTGKVAGCMFRKIVPAKVCQEISENFWKNSALRQREDDVPAYYVGTYHYEKELDTYFSEAYATKNALANLFDNTQNIFAEFILTLEEYLQQYNIKLQLAKHGKDKAAEFLMRSWSNTGSYSLKPHEDQAQCTVGKQRGFEIQSTVNHEIIAVNICLENGESGNLHYWNIQPNDETRKQLGIEETGYPYPENLLLEHEKIIMPIKTGDVYCFNGKNIHAVDELIGATSKRSTISFLMGFRDENTVIYWT